jgi:hypothetical protein
MANYDFKKDLIEGQEGEETIISFLEGKGNTLVSRCDTKTHDTIMNVKGVDTSYEIKTDVYPKDTGNIFIEFECRGKPSGIEVTTSDWFVTYFKHYNEIWFIKTKTLRKLISENNFYTTSNSGDSGSNTKGYLIKKQRFKQFFKVFKLE